MTVDTARNVAGGSRDGNIALNVAGGNRDGESCPKRGGRKPRRWKLPETWLVEAVTVNTARNVVGGSRDGVHCLKRGGWKP